MSADAEAPLPSMVELIDRLTATLNHDFKPGEPVDDAALDMMLEHLRTFRDLAECVEVELKNWRVWQDAIEKRMRASLHQQPGRMQ